MNDGHAAQLLSEDDLTNRKTQVSAAHKRLMTVPVSEPTLGLGRPFRLIMTRKAFVRIKGLSEKIILDTDVFHCYGHRRSISAARSRYRIPSHRFTTIRRKNAGYLFSGNSISGSAEKDLFKDLRRQVRVSVNVISKLGTTIELAIAFCIFWVSSETVTGTEEYGKARMILPIRQAQEAHDSLSTSRDTRALWWCRMMVADVSAAYCRRRLLLHRRCRRRYMPL